MIPRRVNAAWLQPLSTDPALFVNRESQRNDFLRRLEEHREAQLHEANFVVTGARGVGKSIFTRSVLREFQQLHTEHVVCLTVDARNVRYRRFLKNLATDLAEAIRPRAESSSRKELLLWLDQLALLASHDTISQQQSETIARKHGVVGTLGTDLFVHLQAKFGWEETRSLGETTSTSLTVTDEILHAAVSATLARLADKSSPWFVVVFFDDLDQAVIRDGEEDVAVLFRSVLDLRPCISIVHFRTESLIENVAREVEEQIVLDELPADAMMELLFRRLAAATESVRNQFPGSTDWSVVKKLAEQTGSPLVFLRWVHGLLRSQPWPPPADWTKGENLARLVFTADPMNGAALELVLRLVEVADRCDGGVAGRTLRTDDLERGCLQTDPNPPVGGLTHEEIEDLVKLDVLMPKHRYYPNLGLRIKPLLDLLRPSVREKL